MQSKKNIALVASSGGHLQELLKVLPAIGECNFFLVTEDVSYKLSNSFDRVYYVDQTNRHTRLLLLRLVRLLKESIKILSKENPVAVISTGALIAFPFCFAAKIKGAKVIYIESFSRTNSLSLTGKLTYPFADLFFVQWEKLSKQYKKALYAGSLL